jgi:hypothetical protein
MSTEHQNEIRQQPERQEEYFAFLEIKGEIVEQETVYVDQSGKGGTAQD